MLQGGARGQNLGCLYKVGYCSCLYKQLLNKDVWASDMFITSAFNVIRSGAGFGFYAQQAL